MTRYYIKTKVVNSITYLISKGVLNNASYIPKEEVTKEEYDSLSIPSKKVGDIFVRITTSELPDELKPKPEEPEINKIDALDDKVEHIDNLINIMNGGI